MHGLEGVGGSASPTGSKGVPLPRPAGFRAARSTRPGLRQRGRLRRAIQSRGPPAPGRGVERETSSERPPTGRAHRCSLERLRERSEPLLLGLRRSRCRARCAAGAQSVRSRCAVGAQSVRSRCAVGAQSHAEERRNTAARASRPSEPRVIGLITVTRPPALTPSTSSAGTRHCSWSWRDGCGASPWPRRHSCPRPPCGA